MAIEYAMLTVSLDEKEAIEEALQQMWEPFAVYRNEVYFRRQFFNEGSEPRSSTKPENKVQVERLGTDGH